MAFAELSDVEDRLELTLEDGEKNVALSALEDLSVEARHHGKRNWSDQACPPMVKRIVLAATVRYLRNLEGFTQSRAGDETVMFNEVKDGSAGSAHFTTAEIKQLISLASPGNGFGSIQMFAWSNRATAEHTIYVVGSTSGVSPIPVHGGPSEPFPFINTDDLNPAELL